MYVNDLYLHITLNYCAPEQKVHGLQLIGVANKNQYLRHSWTLPSDLKHSETSFSTSSLYLRVAQMPRCGDLAIFMMTTDNRQN